MYLVFTLHAQVYAAPGCVYSTGSEPRVDVSMLQSPMLHLDVFLRRDLSRTWTCLQYMLQSPVLHLDVSTPQGPDVHLNMSMLQSFCTAPGRVYSTGGLELHLEMS
jgi:hypothetical protein